jgi:hypothetical protein
MMNRDGGAVGHMNGEGSEGLGFVQWLEMIGGHGTYTKVLRGGASQTKVQSVEEL